MLFDIIPIELEVAIVTSLIAAVASIIVAVFNYRARVESLSYRRQREEDELVRRDLHVSIARIMLVDNYKKAISKGYYSVEDREVYHPLFVAYKAAGGDGIIDELQEVIVKLPTSK